MGRVREAVAAGAVAAVAVTVLSLSEPSATPSSGAQPSPEPSYSGLPEVVGQAEDGLAVPLTGITDAGLAEPGSLDPAPDYFAEEEGHEEDEGHSDGDAPAGHHHGLEGAEVVALTGALAVDEALAYVVGITWTSSTDLAIDMRSLVGGAWTEWEMVGVDNVTDADAGQAEGAFGTEPFIVAGASAIQVRASSVSGQVPPGLTAHFFTGEDPDSAYLDLEPSAPAPHGYSVGSRLGPPVPADALVGTASRVSVVLPGRLVDNPQPTIHLRTEWGARAPSDEFDVATTQGVVIHHTAGTNSYSRSDVPKILRAIQRYHMDTRDWFDIGYNFLIDKYGRVWEGRAGGILNTAQGAHSHSYNSVATGVSVMGNFQDTNPPSGMVDSLVDFIAWKLTLHGVSATGQILHPNGKTHPAIISHRDVPEASTACPGYRLYRMLPSIRIRVAAAQGLPTLPLGTDVNGDLLPDFAVLDSGVARVYSAGFGVPSSGAPFADASGLNTPLGDYTAFTGGPSLSGSARPDIIAQRGDTGAVYRLRESGRGTLGNAMLAVSTAPSGPLASPGDVTGDGHADVLVAQLSTGEVTLLAGNGTGQLASEGVVATVGALSAFGPAGDANGDGHADLALITDSGALHLLFGDGAGGFELGDSLGEDWSDYTHISYAGDLSGDWIPDLVAQKSSGEGRTVLGSPGGISGEYVPWRSDAPRWRNVFAVPGWGSGTEDAALGLLSGTQGLAWLTPAGAGREFWPSGIEVEVPDAVMATVAGDVDGDGLADLMVLDSSGVLTVRLSHGDGFGDPIEVPDPTDAPEPLPVPAPSPSPTDRPIVDPGWAEYTSVAAAGDIDFDGAPDVVAVTATGEVLVFTRVLGEPAELNTPRMVARKATGWRVFGVGAWQPGAITDLIAITPTGDVRVISGAGLTGGRVGAAFSSGWSDPGAFIPMGQVPGYPAGAVAVWIPATGRYEVFAANGSGGWSAAPGIGVEP